MEATAAAASRRERRRPWRIDRTRAALVAALFALAAVAWAVTSDRMDGMDAGPGTDPGALGFYVTVWVVMMAAMMFPSIHPTVGTYALLQRRRRERKQESARGTVPLFVAGYLVSWTAAGLLGFAILKLARSLDVEALSWSRGGPYVAGGVILAAALYQLTPLKNVCLSHCRGPLMFLIEHWRDGRLGALRMGIAHGAWCVGCCWALMAVLFALGVMSIAWMAVVAGLIAAEKMLPWRRVANLGVAALLVVLGLAVALVPERVPGLTLPDSPDARAAMMQMEGMDSMERGMPGAGSMEAMDERERDSGTQGGGSGMQDGGSGMQQDRGSGMQDRRSMEGSSGVSGR